MVLLLYGVEDDGQHLIIDPLLILNREGCTEVIAVIVSDLLEGLSSLLLPHHHHTI